MPKKVLFLITKSNWGGAQRYVYDLATNLDTTAFTPVVALGGDGELATALRQANIRVITIESLARDVSLGKEVRFARELWQILRTEHPAVLHVNSSKAGGVGTLLGRLARVPRVIFTAHGWAFNEDRPTWQRTLIKLLHWLTVLLSHRTIAVSQAIMEQLSWPGTRARYVCIHPGRRVPDFLSSTAARVALSEYDPQLRTHETDTWIGSLAELHPIKRHRVLLDAVAPLLRARPNTRLVLLGDGSERVALMAQVVTLGIEAQVHFLGHVQEAARFLPALDLFVLASKSESFGYVLVEAGLAERPVVATNVGGIPDIIEPNVTGLLVPPDDTEALREAIASLLAEPAQRRALAHAHHTRCQDFSIEAMVHATATLYEEARVPTMPANSDTSTAAVPR